MALDGPRRSWRALKGSRVLLRVLDGFGELLINLEVSEKLWSAV